MPELTNPKKKKKSDMIFFKRKNRRQLNYLSFTPSPVEEADEGVNGEGWLKVIDLAVGHLIDLIGVIIV